MDGVSLALQAASSDTSKSTTATIQASYAIVPDFFNGLLEAITGKPTYDAAGLLHVPVGVKNNGTEVYSTVHLECGLYRGSDLVGIGDTNIEWVYPGQTVYGTVQKFPYWFDEAAAKVDKADCRAASAMPLNDPLAKPLGKNPHD